MSIRSGLVWLISAITAVILVAATHAQDSRPTRSEEQTMIHLLNGIEKIDLNVDQRIHRFQFSIAPGATVDTIEIVLVAEPDSEASGGRIDVAMNRGRAVTLSPQADVFEARFEIPIDNLESGENTLYLAFNPDGADGWSVDTQASRVRVSITPSEGFDSLSDVEQSLASDFGTPRRIYLDARHAGDDRTAVAALSAQGIALRMGEAPIIVVDPDIAELSVKTSIDPAASTPSIVLTSEREVLLIASDQSSLIAAARMFAASSFDGHARRFSAAQALSAPRLVRGPVGHSVTDVDLSALASNGAPFGLDHGSRSAVVIQGDTVEERAAALAIVGRAALASGSAWIYGWFGNDLAMAPEGHDLFILGPINQLDSRLLASAPSEVKAAVKAAEARLPRERLYFGTAAFANEPQSTSFGVTGMAGIYNDRQGRAVALFTSPEGADFSRAARRLARSGLWNDMQGQAVLWDASVMTPFGPGTAGGFSREAVINFMRMNDRWLALGAFFLAILLLISGKAVNRRERSIS